MAIIIIYNDLSIGNENKSIFKDIRLFADVKEGDDLDKELFSIEKSIEKFKSKGVEIGLCIKYDPHSM
jgi:hypothetical protein